MSGAVSLVRRAPQRLREWRRMRKNWGAAPIHVPGQNAHLFRPMLLFAPAAVPPPVSEAWFPRHAVYEGIEQVALGAELVDRSRVVIEFAHEDISRGLAHGWVTWTDLLNADAAPRRVCFRGEIVDNRNFFFTEIVRTIEVRARDLRTWAQFKQFRDLTPALRKGKPREDDVQDVSFADPRATKAIFVRLNIRDDACPESRNRERKEKRKDRLRDTANYNGDDGDEGNRKQGQLGERKDNQAADETRDQSRVKKSEQKGGAKNGQKKAQKSGQKSAQKNAQKKAQKSGQKSGRKSGQKSGQKNDQRTSRKIAKKSGRRRGQKNGPKNVKKDGQKSSQNRIQKTGPQDVQIIGRREGRRNETKEDVQYEWPGGVRGINVDTFFYMCFMRVRGEGIVIEARTPEEGAISFLLHKKQDTEAERETLGGRMCRRIRETSAERLRGTGGWKMERESTAL